MKIFDNIGCEFIYNSYDKSFTLLGPLPGYSSLSLQDAGVSIPYLARNINGKDIDYELGVGYLDTVGNQLVLKDQKTLSSSNNNARVDFTKPGLKHFYVFVNSLNFNNAFNNVHIESSNFSIEPRKSVYIVDISSGYVIANLPPAQDCEGVELEFRTIGNDGSLSIKNNNFNVVVDSNSYAKILSTGSSWIQLNNIPLTNNRIGALSIEDNSFSMLSDPTGNNRSLQYNDNGAFGSSSLYEGNNGKLLFGSDSESTAKHIIPSSGNNSLIINATREGSNFIVYGSGNAPGYPEKNLYFSYDGKFGINMPSGINTSGIVKPSTILHVFNTLCREGIRLENRANCYPADITLYDNPISYPRADGSGIARIVFAGKDSSGNKINFGTVETKIKSASSKLGQVDISVYDTTSEKTTISSSASKTSISTNSALVELDSNIIRISGTNIGITGVSSVSISGTTSIVQGLRLPYISSSNTLLSVNSDKQVVAATGFRIPGVNTSGENILTTNSDGVVVAEWSKYSFWPYETGVRIGGKDVTWERYPYRSGIVCSNKLTKEFQTETIPLEEFSIGDQIAIINLNNNAVTYRFIDDLTISNDNIVGFILDQNVLFTDLVPNLRVFSVSKGGVLTNTVYTSGVVSDATDIVLSTRPDTNTVFNSKKKNIDLMVYGLESNPTLHVIAEASVGDKKPGQYFKYATQIQASDKTNVPPFNVTLSEEGTGPSNSSANNSANINNVESSWIGKVGTVGSNGKSSHYGTYDQNGNVYEWIEDENQTASYQSYQYICGGSWRTFDNNAIRGYISTPRYSGLDDVGFRICSKAGYSNPTIETLLSLSFTRVDDIGNPEDSGVLYTEDWYNRFGDGNDQPVSITKNNLGVVTYPYRINAYEITNSQYSVFLNSIATGLSSISGLYKASMNTSDVGGIIRSGDGSTTAYSYHVKNNMENKPVVFVDYISSLRFINWLSNGAPSGTGVPIGVTEYGSYTIGGGPGGTDLVTKNRDQNYWLPTLNEWHKAAYYSPLDVESDSQASCVVIRRGEPFEYSNAEPFVSGTGLVAALTVSGLTYTDYLKIGNKVISDTDRSYDNSINFVSNVFSANGTSYIVNQDIEEELIGKAIFRPDRTILTQPLLITTGNATSVDSSAGVLITDKGISYVGPGGNVIDGGLFPGPDGGYLFKDPAGSDVISSSGKLSSVFVEDDYYPILTHTDDYAVIHNNQFGVLDSSSWFTVGKIPAGIETEGTSKVVAVSSPVENNVPAGQETELPPIFCTDRIFIGPPLPGYSGSLLTHNGNKAAYWQPNEFLKAPGATWNRYVRRAIEFVTDDSGSDVRFLNFVNLDPSKGGTGPVSISDIENEFNFNETIAIYNQNREVVYVKVANIGVLDSRTGEINNSFFIDDTALTISVCPPIDRAFVDSSALNLAENDPDDGRLIGYAFSVQKGAFFRMGLEENATSKFACAEEDVETSEYRFKPGSFNTISTRPEIHTVFNTMADDIDFIIYGYRKTLFTRYEPEWFGQDDSGVPTGLSPALRIHAKVDNSYLGSVESGVYKVTVGNNNVATGVIPDLRPKITINTNNPYTISSLANSTFGVILPGKTNEENLTLEKNYGSVIPATGLLVSGISPLSSYADLTVSGVTYTDTLITKDVVLGPLWDGEVPVPYETSLTQKIYAPNYPLTINQLGQIVSMIPPPSPEAPSKPLNLTATPKNSAVVLTWDTPTDNGGINIIGYIVEFSITNGTTWVVYDQINAQTLLPTVSDRNTIRYLDDNIINNTSYIFRIRAYNSVGLGPYSDDSSSVTPTSNLSPATPQNVRITSGEDVYKIRNSQNITLAWDPVTSVPAGTTLLEYVVEYWVYNTLDNTDIKLATWTTAVGSPVDGSETTLNITGIDLAPLYYFSVTAKASNATLSMRSLYGSLGSDTDPRPAGSAPPPTTENPYNFGSVVFLGSCSE